MKKYTGTKTLLARPMTRGEYNTYRGWDTPADEDGTDDGYLVEYMDGGRSNHSAHEGYISWSPADVFENTYMPSETYADRLIIERDELTDRLSKLTTFINNPEVFDEVSQ